MSLNLKFALAYAGAGLPIFPLNGKQPATRHGFKDATTNLQQVEQWWHENPNYNIGLPVPKHTLVLDIDPRSGGAQGLTELENQYGQLPETNTCITGRGDGGRHYYFTAPPGQFTDRNLPDGIDLRTAQKSYLVVPPSIHPDTGGHYYWTGPEGKAELPNWLFELIRHEYKPIEPPALNWNITGDKLVKFVSNLPQGQRNNGLFWACCEAIKDGSWAFIKNDLQQAAQHIGLTEPEINGTFASAERRASQP